MRWIELVKESKVFFFYLYSEGGVVLVVGEELK